MMDRSMRMSGAVSFVVLVIGVVQASGQGTRPSAKWAPDPAILKQLGRAAAVENYMIRIPKGYEVQQAKNAPAGMRMWGWTGPDRTDGTKPSITMSLLTIPPAEREQVKSLSLEQLAEKLVGGKQRMLTNWKPKNTEKGVINGMDFARIHWRGSDPRRGSDMRGFLYVARDGDNIVQIASQDLMPETDKALSLAETSVYTFRK
jgi:hypothetical protein